MYGQWNILMSIGAATVEGSTMVKYLSTTIAVIVIGCSNVFRDYRATSQVINYTDLEPVGHGSITCKPAAKN
jgi:hypothetical protein